MATKTKTNLANESARDRFVRLAEIRTSRALSGIRQLQTLANQQRYEYSETDIRIIEDAIVDATGDAMKALRAGETPTRASFKL